MKKIQIAILVFALLAPSAAFSLDCDVYHEAIMHCAKQGCDTTIDDFSTCLVEEQGISERAADGTNEIDELIKCFHTEYKCNWGDVH